LPLRRLGRTLHGLGRYVKWTFSYSHLLTRPFVVRYPEAKYLIGTDSLQERVMCRNALLFVATGFAISTASLGRADEKPILSTEYFLGESKMTTPGGQVVRTTLSLVKRVIKPAENKIEEHVMTIDEKTPAKSF